MTHNDLADLGRRLNNVVSFTSPAAIAILKFAAAAQLDLTDWQQEFMVKLYAQRPVRLTTGPRPAFTRPVDWRRTLRRNTLRRRLARRAGRPVAYTQTWITIPRAHLRTGPR